MRRTGSSPTRTRRSPASRPWPRTSSMLCDSSHAIWLLSSRALTIRSRRRSTESASSLPLTASAAPGTRAASARTSWGRSSAFEGMQASYEHSPPTRWLSTSATRLPPRSARRPAAISPAGPAPITTTSNSRLMSFSSLRVVGESLALHPSDLPERQMDSPCTAGQWYRPTPTSIATAPAQSRKNPGAAIRRYRSECRRRGHPRRTRAAPPVAMSAPAAAATTWTPCAPVAARRDGTSAKSSPSPATGSQPRERMDGMPIRFDGAGRDSRWTTRAPLFGAPARRCPNRLCRNWVQAMCARSRSGRSSSSVVASDCLAQTACRTAHQTATMTWCAPRFALSCSPSTCAAR